MPDFALFLLAAVLLTLAPGPDNLQVLLRGMTQGRSAALAASAGFASGVVVHTALAAGGVSLAIRSSPLLFALLKYAGAAYLIYLGLRVLRRPEVLLPAAGPAGDRLAAVFRQSFVGNVLNPKVGLFFLSFLPQFIDAGAGHGGRQMLLLGVLFMVQAFLIFAAIGWFAASLGGWLRRDANHARWLNRIAGLTFVAIGLRLALTDGR